MTCTHTHAVASGGGKGKGLASATTKPGWILPPSLSLILDQQDRH